MRKGTLGLPSPRGEGTPVRTLGGMRGRFCCDFRCVGGHRPLIRHGLYRPRHLPPKGKARAMTGNFPGKLVLSLRQTDFQSVGAGLCSALFSSMVRVSGGAKPRPLRMVCRCRTPSTRPRRWTLPHCGPPGRRPLRWLPLPSAIHPTSAVDVTGSRAIRESPLRFLCHHMLYTVPLFPHKVPNLHKNSLTKAASCLYNTVCAVFGAAIHPLRQGQGSAVE